MQQANALGRRLFEIKSSPILGILATTISLGFLTAAITVLSPEIAFSFVFISIALFFAGLAANTFLNKTECFEQGIISHRWYQKTKILNFSNLSSYTYKAVKHSYNGIPTGTAVDMVLFPQKDSGEKIKISKHTANGDKDMEALRDHLAEILSERMYCVLQETNVQRIKWTASAELSKEGIHFLERKFFGNNGAPTMIPFDKGFEYLNGNGTFELRIPGEKNNRVILDVAGPNFFPGVILMERLLQDKRDQHVREVKKEQQGFDKSFFGTLAAGAGKNNG